MAEFPWTSELSCNGNLYLRLGIFSGSIGVSMEVRHRLYQFRKGEKHALCGGAERYVEDDLKKQGRVVDADGFLVSGQSKLIGLCLRDMSGSDGQVVFKRGAWYGPAGETRRTLRACFGIDGERFQHFPLLTQEAQITIGEGEWVYLRDNNRPDPEAYMAEIDRLVASGNFAPVPEKGYHATYEPMGEDMDRVDNFIPVGEAMLLR
jgi:hypothetical protein